MSDIRLKSDEMMFFVDFNNTLVDYENEYDVSRFYIDKYGYVNPYRTRIRLAKALIEFEQKTGITPVICIVTNARDNIVDHNGYQGIHNDLFMTFFYEDEFYQSDNNIDCKKFFKYLVYYENDHFYKIHPKEKALTRIYEKIDFDSNALEIRYISQFKKKESVDRIMSMVDPKRDTSRFILFAGDSIKDDYPMKEIWTPEGVSKVFIRPGKAHKLNYSIRREFCEAKGLQFTSVNPKNGKRVNCIDEPSYSLLKPEEKQMIDDFASGDYVFLTQRNTAGLIDGINKTAELIVSLQSPQKQMM